MRIPVIAATSLVITLVFVSAGISQEEKPPDYSKKSLAEWIKALKDEKNAEGRMEASEALGPNGP